MQATAHDVAAYVISQLGPMRAMKLEKLVYYSQAWRLGWHGEPLFADPIEAWKDGPIARSLWNRHRGQDVVRKWQGVPDALTDSQKETVDRVLSFYGTMSGNELSFLTHSEDPWIDARQGLAPNQPGTRTIEQGTMRAYYSKGPILVNSGDPRTMLHNLVRKLPDGSWGINRAHPQRLYIGHAMRLIAPVVASETAL